MFAYLIMQLCQGLHDISCTVVVPYN